MQHHRDVPGRLSSAQVTVARERFFASRGQDLDPMVRPVIARSWKRSLGCRIARDQRSLVVSSLPRVDRGTLGILESVVEEFSRAVDDVAGTVTFTDGYGTLTLVRSSGPNAERVTDLFPVGAQLLEEIIGTNSDGIVIEERHPVQVWSGEHVLDIFQGNCCTSAPVFDPVNRSLLGVLTLTVSEQTAQRITASALVLLVAAYAAQAQVRIEQVSLPPERQLLHDFLREHRKRGNDFVVASDGKVAIASAAYLAQASKYDIDVVLSILSASGHSESDPKRVASSDGTGFTVRVRPVDGGYGAVASLKADLQRGRSDGGAEPSAIYPGLVGINDEFLKAVRSGALSVRQFEPLILAGEFGAGKASIAAAISQDLQIPLQKFDCVNGLQELRSFLASEGKAGKRQAVFLQHAELLEAEELAQLIALLRQIPYLSLICTVENNVDSMRMFATTHDVNFIQVPSLRRRRDDIPLLIEHFLSGTGASIDAALKSTFSSANWPGNIQQLRKVLAYAAANCSGDEISLRDLDETDRKLLSHGRLTRLEEAELDQIRAAIFEAEGNKSQAAAILEIGRSTLYRRVDYFLRRGFSIGE